MKSLGSPDFQLAVFGNLVKVRIGMYESWFVDNRITGNGKTNADGSLTWVFGPKPFSKYPASNWLPSISGQKYNLTFRFYRPGKDVTDGSYFPSALQQVEGL